MALTRVENQIVELDYREFKDQHFINCKLVFKGGRPPSLTGCTLEESEFVFEGPAWNTVAFLRAFAGEGNAGGKDLVLAILGFKQ